jgi:hypothetical protein
MGINLVIHAEKLEDNTWVPLSCYPNGRNNAWLTFLTAVKDDNETCDQIYLSRTESEYLVSEELYHLRDRGLSEILSEISGRLSYSQWRGFPSDVSEPVLRAVPGWLLAKHLNHFDSKQKNFRQAAINADCETSWLHLDELLAFDWQCPRQKIKEGQVQAKYAHCFGDNLQPFPQDLPPDAFKVYRTENRSIWQVLWPFKPLRQPRYPSEYRWVRWIEWETYADAAGEAFMDVLSKSQMYGTSQNIRVIYLRYYD